MEESWVIKIAFTGWKKNQRNDIPLVLSVLLILAGIAIGWEEEGDNVNVISVENLDALLGLRMVTELNLKNLTTPEQRSRRGVRQQMENLCGKEDCDCESKRRSVSCSFQTTEVVALSYGSLNSHVHHLNITNLTELSLFPGAFFKNPSLLSVTLTDTAEISIGKDVFRTTINRPYFNFEVTNCNTLIIHDAAFSNVGCPLRVTIENCSNVILKKSVFPATLWLRINNVPNLEMNSYTFYVERRVDTRTTADMGFNSVMMKIIPSWSFKLSGARISFFNSTIDIIDREAFRALQLESVHFHNVDIKRFEMEAFSAQTSIKDVTLADVRVQFMAGQTLSAATNLTIRNSRIVEISDGAFNISTAFLKLTENTFCKIGRHSFTIQSWNSIIISGNEFESLKQDTFLAPFSKVENVTNEFIFSNNLVNATEVNSLSFVPNDVELEVTIWNNTFLENCHCHLESWILTLTTDKWKSFYDTSNCRISEFGSCYNLEGGYMDMKNYTEIVCNASVNTKCDIRSVSEDDFLSELDLKDTERTILGVIFLGVACSIAIMIIILSISWIRQKGICSELWRFATSSSLCCFSISQMCNSSNLVTSSSISRINIHEYAEIQYQMTEQQKQTILTINGAAEEDIMVICEDKATQTLPEELTQELLQSLREKLDDPENYNEARNMIEHLYDLIKVEESCNNNNVSRTSLLLDDDDEEEEEPDVGGNVYDVITKKPRKTSKRVRKNSTSNVRTTGTRAPSPDKLSPVAFNLPRATIVNEYAEPRDRRSNEYHELPGSRDIIMPDVLAAPVRDTIHVYALPSRRMENRPLPSRPGTSDETS